MREADHDVPVPSHSSAGHAGRAAFADGGPLHIASSEPTTLTEALLRTSSRFPDKGIHVVHGAGQREFLSYEQLLGEARCVLGGLQERGLEPGDRVVLQIESLRDYFAAFWGCVLGGVIPVCVATPPAYVESSAVVKKLHNVWRLLGGPTVIASRHLVGPIADVGEKLSMAPLRLAAIDELKQSAASGEIRAATPGDVVFYQLTSGSTGIPKCIQETHRGIVAHVHSSAHVNSYSSGDVTLNWLPLDHVVPILTCHLKDVYLGCQQVSVKTEYVLANAIRWLDLLHEHRVTLTWAPNFAFKLVADALAKESGEKKWDLSCVRYFMNAGEQVTVPVVEEFLGLTKAFGVRAQAMQPAFGMAEVCTCVTYENTFTLETGARRFLKRSLSGVLEETTRRDSASIEFVSLGPPGPGVQIRITDSENRLASEGAIGRLQIKGPMVTPGYLYNDEANGDAFVGDGWFNTGDLGFILEGRLYLTGREKEVIIVRGANFYCYEIEDVVNRIEGVEPTFVAACPIDDAATGTESLAVFFVAKDGADAKTLSQTIRTKVAAAMGVAPTRVIGVSRNDFPKTTSGKIQRTQLKNALQAGQFASAPKGEDTEIPIGNASRTEQGISAIWREVLNVSHARATDSFFELGGDSLRAFQVLSRVREQFQVELPLAALFDGPATVADMASRVEQLREWQSAPVLPAITRQGQAKAPLSYPQQLIWLLEQREGGGSMYNVTRALWLRGRIDHAALAQSLNDIVNRHEILRTVFGLEAAGPVQTVLPEQRISLPVVQVPNLASPERSRRAMALARELAEPPFDLTRGPLLRATLFQFEEEESFLAICQHQIVIDGWSVGVFFQELRHHYLRLSGQATDTLADLHIQYADVAAWQRSHLQGPAVSNQLAYWKGRLSGKLPIMWPSPRRVACSRRAETELLVLPKDCVDTLKAFNRAEHATLFMTLLSVYVALLHHRTALDDILVGSAVSGRDRLETEPLIGFLVNTVVLRNTVTGEQRFRDLLGEVRKTSLEAFANATLPFEKLVEVLQRERGRRGHPIFQAWFSFMDAMADFQIGSLRATPVHVPPPEAQFDLSLFIVERPDEVHCFFEYKTDLFRAEVVRQLMQQYAALLRVAVEHPDEALQRLLARSTAGASGSSSSRSSAESAHALFEAQVKRRPSAIAVTCGGESLTYAELDERANRLAHYLVRNGVGPEVKVGLAVRRSLEMVIGILGILKAGGAYVPLDPSYPRGRLQYMLAESAPPIVLTQSALKPRLPESAARLVCLDSDWPVIAQQPDSPSPVTVAPDDLAYVMFTSGSTGKPKGVLVTHANLRHSTEARFAFYPETLRSYLLISSFSVDSSVAGIFWTLGSGGNLILPQEGLQQDPQELIRLIETHRVSHLLALPSLYKLLLEHADPRAFSTLRVVIVAGESCAEAVVGAHAKAVPGATLYNEYGPTEATVWATATALKAGDTVTIGKAIPGSEVWLFDDDLRPVCKGESGEICIGGRGVARGYLNHPKMTAQRFIHHRDPAQTGARLYRTGDLGRFLPDGRIQFLGRVDHQVKIRGFRIELEEIESVLRRCPQVQEAAVLARPDDTPDAEKQLVAYVVTPDGAPVNVTDLRRHLGDELPAYMVPSAFVCLSHLPRTPHGKIDRLALPAPLPAARNVESGDDVPRTPIERKLAAIWSDVLGRDGIGLRDNFFDLGGHSLLAMQAIARIRRSFGVELPVLDMFETPTIASLAEQLFSLLLERSRPGELSQTLTELEHMSDDEARNWLAGS